MADAMQPFQRRMNTAAQVSLVALFFAFPMALGAANTLLLVILLCWLLAGHFRQRWAAIRHNPITTPMLMLYGLILAGTLYTTAPPLDAWNHLGKYSKFLFALVLLSLLGEARWRQRCWHAFIAAMLITLASSYANIWFDLPWSNTQQPGWGLDHHVFGDYITQDIMMAFFVLLALNRGVSAASQRRRWSWYATAALGAVSVTHMSHGRSGYLVLAAGLLVFTLFSVPGNRRLVAVAALALVFASVFWTSHTMRTRFALASTEAANREVDNQSSIGHRLYNYRKVPRLILERPLLGWGTGAYHEQICRVVEKPEWCRVFNWHPHNQFLFFGVDHGLRSEERRVGKECA